MAVPQYVFFDLGNVLLTFDNDRACRQMARRAQVPVETVRDFFQEHHYQVQLETGAVTAKAVFQHFCRRVPLKASLAEMKHAGSDMFDGNWPILGLITRLVTARVRVGVLSNTSAPHWELVSDGRFRFLNDLFDDYALSFQLGARKPDRRIYEAAARLAGVAPEMIFFTDDRPENVAGAQAAGWQAVQFESVAQLAAALRTAGLQFGA